MKKPRILIWDLETSGVNALHADLGFIVCFGYKWLGEKKTHCLTFDQYGGYKRNGYSDKGILRAATSLFREADLLVAHFGDYFDLKFVQGRLAINGMDPIPPTKQLDTCRLSWRKFKFFNNRLKFLAKTLGCKHQKGENKFPEWWHRVLAGDRKAVQLMAEYCKQDVRTLEEVYLKLRRFDDKHPRVMDSRRACLVCGGSVHYRGVQRAQTNSYRRFQCTKCGKWGRDSKALKVVA